MSGDLYGGIDAAIAHVTRFIDGALEAMLPPPTRRPPRTATPCMPQPPRLGRALPPSAEEGPFDGLLGFSQGANLCAIVAADLILRRPAAADALRFAVLFNGTQYGRALPPLRGSSTRRARALPHRCRGHFRANEGATASLSILRHSAAARSGARRRRWASQVPELLGPGRVPLRLHSFHVLGKEDPFLPTVREGRLAC